MGQRGRRYVLEHRTYGAIAAAVEKQLLDIVEPDADRPETAALLRQSV